MSIQRNVRRATLAVVIGFFAVGSDYAYAGGCDDYPYSAGQIEIHETPAGRKILATGVATVDFDDSDEIIDATQEATMEAKAAISEFFSVTIHSDRTIDTATKKTIKLIKGPKGDQKTGSKEKIKTTLRRLASHSKSLLRGVVKLAECYTKGKKVMVSVGLKPETIAAAEAATGAIGASITRQPTTTKSTSSAGTGSTENERTETPPAGSTGTATTGPDSYIKGMKALKNFCSF